MAIAAPNDFGGYDYYFVDSIPDRVVCKICYLPSRDPYLTTCCGHVFCKSCLNNAKKAATTRGSITKGCPVCCDKKFVTFCNKQLDREVKGLHVMCTNKERGCQWQGELNDVNNHLGNNDGCQFEDVKCSNECGKMLQRQYLTSHVETECPRRKVDCQHCHLSGECKFIEGDHKELCLKLPLPCPNKCKVSCPCSARGRKRRAHPYSRKTIKFIPREDMEAHRKECPLQDVKCLLDCGSVLKRQDLINHVERKCRNRKSECHLCHLTGGLQFIEGEHKEQCPKLPLPCPNKCEVGSVPREDMEAHRKECPLEMVQCEYHNVGCEERMMRKELEVHKKEYMEKHLSLTTLQLTYALKHIDTLMAAVHPIVPQANCIFKEMHSSSPAVAAAQWSLKLKGRAALNKSADPVCPVVFHVTEFTKKRIAQTRWLSHSFFSHDKGYKMFLRVDVAGHGDGKGTHLSVFLYLMKGPHDGQLRWPMREKFRIRLLNQISDREHHMMTADDVNASRVPDGSKANSWGHQKFISNEGLHKITSTCQFVKDNSIFFRISKT